MRSGVRRMHWDVVEVKPEPDYCLFVRFQDGLTGRVRLRREELTGGLAPLRDVHFFERVFIDYGAVAWPGEIDLGRMQCTLTVARQHREPQQSFETTPVKLPSRK